MANTILDDSQVLSKLRARLPRDPEDPAWTDDHTVFICVLVWQGILSLPPFDIQKIVWSSPGVEYHAKNGYVTGNFEMLRAEGRSRVGVKNLSQDDFLRLLHGYSNALTPALHKLASGEISLGIWAPSPDLDAESIAFAKGLALPHLRETPLTPSLLLHDLGRFSRDKALKARVDAIFCGEHTYLCNASGSGKTRLLLEGLCMHWGIYLTCCKENYGIGSSDLQQMLYLIKTSITPLSGQKGSQAHSLQLRRNEAAVRGHILAVLFSRLHVLNLFLRCLPPRPWMPEAEIFYRKQWLILQLDPGILAPAVDRLVDDLGLHSHDVFLNIARLVTDHCPEEFLRIHLEEKMFAVIQTGSTPSCGDDRQCGPRFYVVMDEVQTVTNEASGAFESSAHPGRPRPLLREVVTVIYDRFHDWSTVSIVPTGTNVSQCELADAIESLIQKNVSHSAYRCTGGLETIEAVRDYVLPFLPPRLTEKKTWMRLLRRIYMWLRGRYRFTAGYLVRLLRNGFASPHLVLNHYVWDHTHYMPSDANELVGSEPPLLETIVSNEMKLRDINWAALRNDTPSYNRFINHVRMVVFDCLLRSSTRLALGATHAPAMVGLGFARYTIEDAYVPQPTCPTTSHVNQARVSELAASVHNQDEDRQLLDDESEDRPNTYIPPLAPPPPDSASGEISEPLVLLRLASELDDWPTECTYHYLAQKIHDTGSENNGWENYVAHCLVRLFSSEEKFPLSQIFHLRKISRAGPRGESLWQDDHSFDQLMSLSATVVGIVRSWDGELIGTGELIDDTRPGPTPHDQRQPPIRARPTCNSGTRVGNMLGALSWFRTTPTPILFPNNNMGPDIFFLLRLSDGKLMWVAVQCKYDVPTALTFKSNSKVLQTAARSITPSQFFIPKSGATHMAFRRNKVVLERMALPNMTDLAGKHGVLRVVACFPSKGPLEEMEDPDTDGHPLVMLDCARLDKSFGGMEPKEIISGTIKKTKESILKASEQRKKDLEAQELQAKAKLGEPLNWAGPKLSSIEVPSSTHAPESTPAARHNPYSGASLSLSTPQLPDPSGEPPQLLISRPVGPSGMHSRSVSYSSNGSGWETRQSDGKQNIPPSSAYEDASSARSMTYRSDGQHSYQGSYPTFLANRTHYVPAIPQFAHDSSRPSTVPTLFGDGIGPSTDLRSTTFPRHDGGRSLGQEHRPPVIEVVAPSPQPANPPFQNISSMDRVTGDLERDRHMPSARAPGAQRYRPQTAVEARMQAQNPGQRTPAEYFHYDGRSMFPQHWSHNTDPSSTTPNVLAGNDARQHEPAYYASAATSVDTFFGYPARPAFDSHHGLMRSSEPHDSRGFTRYGESTGQWHGGTNVLPPRLPVPSQYTASDDYYTSYAVEPRAAPAQLDSWALQHEGYTNPPWVQAAESSQWSYVDRAANPLPDLAADCAQPEGAIGNLTDHEFASGSTSMPPAPTDHVQVPRNNYVNPQWSTAPRPSVRRNRDDTTGARTERPRVSSSGEGRYSQVLPSFPAATSNSAPAPLPAQLTSIHHRHLRAPGVAYSRSAGATGSTHHGSADAAAPAQVSTSGVLGSSQASASSHAIPALANKGPKRPASSEPRLPTPGPSRPSRRPPKAARR